MDKIDLPWIEGKTPKYSSFIIYWNQLIKKAETSDSTYEEGSFIDEMVKKYGYIDLEILTEKINPPKEKERELKCPFCETLDIDITRTIDSLNRNFFICRNKECMATGPKLRTKEDAIDHLHSTYDKLNGGE